jgi:type I restriction enzyme, S subunit
LGEGGLPIVRIEQLKNPDAPTDCYGGKLPPSRIIEDGDLIFSWSASLFLRIWHHGRAALNQHLFKVIEYDEIDRAFLKYFIEYYLPALTAASHGSTMQHITRKELERFGAPIPECKPEQTKISEILSALDRAIEQTEALIAKQQRIKTGLMQDLLTRGIDERGNLRSESTHKFKDSPLGRVPVEWDVSKLDSIGTWSSGGTPSKANASYWEGDIPWVCPKDMKTFDIASTIERLTQAGVRHGSRVMPAKTVFIVVRGMILAHTFPVCISGQPMSFNQDVKAIVANSDIEPRFLAYWFVSHGNDFLKITTTATHGTKRFDMKELYEVMMPVPEREEQRRIVTRLDIAEAQIGSNKKTAAKLHSLKLGLMQDLLTGKKRVTPLLELELTH